MVSEKTPKQQNPIQFTSQYSSLKPQMFQFSTLQKTPPKTGFGRSISHSQMNSFLQLNQNPRFASINLSPLEKNHDQQPLDRIDEYGLDKTDSLPKTEPVKTQQTQNSSQPRSVMIPQEFFFKKRHDPVEDSEDEDMSRNSKPAEICLVMQKGVHHSQLFKRYFERFRVLSFGTTQSQKMSQIEPNLIRKCIAVNWKDQHLLVQDSRGRIKEYAISEGKNSQKVTQHGLITAPVFIQPELIYIKQN